MGLDTPRDIVASDDMLKAAHAYSVRLTETPAGDRTLVDRRPVIGIDMNQGAVGDSPGVTLSFKCRENPRKPSGAFGKRKTAAREFCQ